MREIFCNAFVLQDFDHARGEMQLKEEETGQNIIVGGIPNDAILLKLDVSRKPYKVRSIYLRSGLEFIHKGCDYCLILPSLNLALLFELKSMRPKGYADQFVASELFVDYCVKLWNRFSCNHFAIDYRRILLSPKFDRFFTSHREVHKFTVPDRCNNDIQVISPGFPTRVRLEKLL